jgi:hypothetical protein
MRIEKPFGLEQVVGIIALCYNPEECRWALSVPSSSGLVGKMTPIPMQMLLSSLCFRKKVLILIVIMNRSHR